MKYLLGIIILLVVLGGGWYFADSQGLFQTKPEMGEPTAEERARMSEIEQESNVQANDAVPGIGVRLQGDTPPPSEPASSTATTTDSTEEETEQEATDE